MKRSKMKILVCTAMLFCAAAAAGTGAVISGMSGKNAIPASLISDESEPPVIILDAGHGGFDGGCISVDGVPEKGINLSILLRLRDLLEISGYKVEVTRDSDISIHDSGIEGLADQKSSDMDNRLALFNKYSDAVCISIHQNQFTDPKYSGAQMFYSSSDSRSEKLAKCLQSSFSGILQPDNDREIKLCGKELFLCYFSKNPTVMAECGFLSNPQEAAMLNTEEYQQKVAMTLYAGLCKYLNER